MNINYEDISAFKRYNLPEIITSYGHDLKKQGEGYITNCPFHDDKTPSLSISQKGDTWLWHCFGCRKGGTVIDFVMKIENLSLQETYKKLSGMVPRAAKREDKELKDYELLKKVTDYYQKTFREDHKGREYLEKRGLTGSEIRESFRIGYANGTLKRMLPLRGVMIARLKELGILNEKGNETFYNCVVIPLLDENGSVVSLYGRNISRKGHLYLKGQHKGLVNRQGAYNAEKVILTESIIDALSLYQLGIQNVIPCYGTGGFTQDHEELIREKNIKEIEIAYDNDEAGRTGGEALSEKLLAAGAGKITRIILPEEVKDINDYLLGGATRDKFEQLARIPLKKPLYEIKKEGNIIHLKRDGIEYRVRGADKEYIRNMRVNIRLMAEDDYTIDIIDLYSERSRKNYIKRMNKRFDIQVEALEKDLFKIIEEVEILKDPASEAENNEEVEYILTEKEKIEALRELKRPDLVRRIMEDLGKIGCVGEEMNKLLGYVVTVSRKLDQPLSMIIVSQSGAGKSNLAGILEEVTPREESIHLSRITPQALYYMDRKALKRKVLVIEERQGGESADYSIRVLQSENCLRLAVPIKDPQTGKLKTQVFEVEGPVVVIETTTRTDLNPENTSRCFIVYMDETEQQTKRIHRHQKLGKTIGGAEERENVKGIIRKHRNMQRLLERIVVSNPYVDHITFPTKWLRVRRDHMKFLNLIEAVTFLHQHQRERKLSSGGIEYIESTIEDYRVAYEIAKDVIGDCLTELMKPERDLYDRIEEMVREERKEKFTRRNLREYTGLADHIVRRTLRTLVEMEYILVAEGRNGVKYEYTLNQYPREAKDIIQGLTTPEELERKLTLRKPCENLESRLSVSGQTV